MVRLPVRNFAFPSRRSFVLVPEIDRYEQEELHCGGLVGSQEI
jgi:hypothetical protein